MRFIMCLTVCLSSFAIVIAEPTPILRPTDDMLYQNDQITDTPIQQKDPTPSDIPFVLQIPYSIEWRISLPDTYHVGLTPVRDTLLWVSEGSATTGSADPPEIYVYNLRTLALVDSFNQPGVPLGWGWRDMTSRGDTVFASYDASVRVIHVPTRTVVRSFSPTTLNPHRALAWNPGDSLYSANFASAIWQFYKTTPFGARSIPNIDTSYGLGYDGNGFVWMSVQTDANLGKIAKFSYPAVTKIAEQVIPEISGVAGGCEMWRDTFLLYLNQGTPDEVVCIRLYFGTPVQETSETTISKLKIKNPVRAPLILEGVSRLEIYDVLGKKINEIENRVNGAKLIWNGKDENGASLPSGVYFLRMETEQGHTTSKAVLLR